MLKRRFLHIDINPIAARPFYFYRRLDFRTRHGLFALYTEQLNGRSDGYIPVFFASVAETVQPKLGPCMAGVGENLNDYLMRFSQCSVKSGNSSPLCQGCEAGYNQGIVGQ
jgi:hypothetical protein